ncbi:DUF914 domain membrane protein [Aspergillus saccharolyticus JOP 1030-1]|uniref:DUF914-domain-containing protein n=1 Tax=Aspergillus saccharolyticus JOP 1030-1 TaxID=1450539 RepID=A0A318Z366_9EURO|nr:DUF914-domain-containing protein [Aspergillus saccharolyticus JOP 1030-1]PYH41741.1 DUF914-domain-containing protein [Aspergillus saccharolyticus JOP 1030-1]
MPHSAVSHGTDTTRAGPSATGTDLGRPPKLDTPATNLYTNDDDDPTDADETTPRHQSPFAYLTTREFYLTLLLGQILAITNTACSTFSALLADRDVSFPAFQTFFNYLLLSVIFTTYTIHREGLRGWQESLLDRGWKYLLLSLCDVEGNYFLVLAYRHTTLLSAQLINFWAIAVVVLLSTTFLGVSYHRGQILGIAICISGILLLLLTDTTTDTQPDHPKSPLLGDLYALLGATTYGLANTAEEILVCTAPVAEVLAHMSLFGTVITAVQSLCLEAPALRTRSLDAEVLGYMAGYTLCLGAFYCLVPLLLRRASAAFFNLSMLTMNCWGVVVGVLVFRYVVSWGYPVAFGLVVLGQGVYFLGGEGNGWKRGVRGVTTLEVEEEEGGIGGGIGKGKRKRGKSASSEEDPLLGSESDDDYD